MAAMFVWLAVGAYITPILRIQLSPILMGLFLAAMLRAHRARRDASSPVAEAETVMK
jgi:hypothetical protein